MGPRGKLLNYVVLADHATQAAFMDKKTFSQLMDDVIERKLLDGNTAQEPKKTVRIMVCADFEDSCIPEEKVRLRVFHAFH